MYLALIATQLCIRMFQTWHTMLGNSTSLNVYTTLMIQNQTFYRFFKTIFKLINYNRGPRTPDKMNNSSKSVTVKYSVAVQQTLLLIINIIDDHFLFLFLLGRHAEVYTGIIRIHQPGCSCFWLFSFIHCTPLFRLKSTLNSTTGASWQVLISWLTIYVPRLSVAGD